MEEVFDAFESGIIQRKNKSPRILANAAKVSDCKQLRILTPKQMLQRFLPALAQVMAGNTSLNLLNEICSLYPEK